VGSQRGWLGAGLGSTLMSFQSGMGTLFRRATANTPPPPTPPGSGFHFNPATTKVAAAAAQVAAVASAPPPLSANTPTPLALFAPFQTAVAAIARPPATTTTAPATTIATPPAAAARARANAPAAHTTAPATSATPLAAATHAPALTAHTSAHPAGNVHTARVTSDKHVTGQGDGGGSRPHGKARTVHMARVTGLAYSVLALGATAISQPSDHCAVICSFSVALD